MKYSSTHDHSSTNMQPRPTPARRPQLSGLSLPTLDAEDESLPTKKERWHNPVYKYLEDLINDHMKIPYKKWVYVCEDEDWQESLDDVQEFLEEVEDHIRRGDLQSMSQSRVEKGIYALDHLLFNNDVSKRMKRLNFGWLTETGEDGEDLLGEVEITDTETRLRMNARQDGHKNSLDLLGTLLHEMCHMCVGQSIDLLGPHPGEAGFAEWRKALDVFERLEGKTGHGYHWMKMSLAVEDRAREVLEDNTINLGCLDALLVECLETKRIPGEEFFDELFGNPKWPDRPDPIAARRHLVEHVLEHVDDADGAGEEEQKEGEN